MFFGVFCVKAWKAAFASAEAAAASTNKVGNSRNAGQFEAVVKAYAASAKAEDNLFFSTENDDK